LGSRSRPGLRCKRFITFLEKSGYGLLFYGKLRVTAQASFPEKAIRVSFCHHACDSSIRHASAGGGDDYEGFQDADVERMTEADLNKHAREHWGIENKKHYIRDTVYREDGNQSWKGSGPQTLASFRNFSTSLFAMKEVKNIKEATEIVHMDRHLAFRFMTT
jgi:hypothetical protein